MHKKDRGETGTGRRVQVELLIVASAFDERNIQFYTSALWDLSHQFARRNHPEEERCQEKQRSATIHVGILRVSRSSA
jgi:hypothetical protein